ncbi:TonB-dependent siderophore receptor [Vibrio alginolyticus]|nr:TonB-dependent siderophore receptor [Vibrio alginolyticus]
MTNHNFLTIAIRKALVCAIAPAAVVSFMAQAQDDVTEMETITVTAQALKVETPAAETPRSVSIISEEELRVRAPQKLDEALRYTSGVTAQPYGADNDTDWFFIRGFEGASYLDGTRLYRDGYYTWLLEPYGLESVEVVKGPNAILFGDAAPGGVVNAVQKKPTFTPQGELKVEVGNNNHKSIDFDIADEANDTGTMRYRLVGLMTSKDGELDGTENERFYIAPSLELDISDRTMLTLMATYLKDDGIPTNPFLPIAGTAADFPLGDIKPGTNLGETNYDNYEREQMSIGYRLAHDLNEGWSLNQTFNYGYNKLNLISSYIFSYPDYDENYLPVDDSYSRGIVYRDGKTQSFSLDNNAVGNWVSGSNEHTVLAGIDLQHHKTEGYEEQGFGMANIGAINPWAPEYGKYTPFEKSDLIDREIDKTLVSLYTQYQIKYDQKWVGQVGGRYDWYDVNNESVKGNEKDSASGGNFTLNAGLMYVSDFGITPYVSYAEGFEVLSTLDGAWGTASEDKQLYEPRESEQWEMGVKYTPDNFDGYVNVAWFDITNKNALTQSRNSGTQTQTGESTSKGVEIEAIGQVTPDVKVSAAYTYTDAKVDTNSTGQYVQAPLIPEHQATVWVDYDSSALISGLYVGTGVRYIGETVSDAGAYIPVTVDASTLWDATISYEITSQWQAQLNINNILDKEYIAGCDYYCYYGQSRSVMLNANYRW